MDIQINKYNNYKYIAVYTNDLFVVTGVGVTISAAIDDALLQYSKTSSRLKRLGET